MVAVRKDPDDEVIWIEDQPMSDKAKELTDVLKGMNIKERSIAVLDMLAHDADVMQVVRSRMIFELREAIQESIDEIMKEDKRMHCNSPMPSINELLGSSLSNECDTVLPIIFPDDFESIAEE